MRSSSIFKIFLVLALLEFTSGATTVHSSCGLSLPCKSSVQSGKTAFSITNKGNGGAGLFAINNTDNNKAALVGRTNSSADNAYGVLGRVSSTLAGNLSAGVVGTNKGTNPDALPILLMGVWGVSDSTSGLGVLGQSNAGIGVRGLSTVGIAMFGETTDPAGGIGVWGKSNTRGVVGTQGNTSCPGTYGIGGCATTGNGIYGQADTGYAVLAQSNTGVGILGKSNNAIGVWGNSSTRGIVGTLGSTSCAGTYGVGGCAVDGDGVVGRSTNGRAGYFIGNVQITGTLTKGAGAFKIDHPLDPQNKYLYHSFVESSDMMGIYTGNVALNQQGEATLILPDWFDALNRDFRYQLTAIGAPAPNLYIAEPIKNNRFKIAGGQPKMTVSWQVTGVRHDPYSELHRIPVEEMKPEEERGKYLHPLAYGKPQEMGEDRVGEPDMAVASLRPGAVQTVTRNSQNSPSIPED